MNHGVSDPDNPFDQIDYGPNPFAPYVGHDAEASDTRVRGEIRAPALALLVLSLLSIVGIGVGLAVNIYVILDEGLDPSEGTPGYFFCAIAILLNVAVAWGMICMLRLRRWNTARISAIIALIPPFSPLFVFGIPFGIWALVVLNRVETKAAFES